MPPARLLRRLPVLALLLAVLALQPGCPDRTALSSTAEMDEPQFVRGQDLKKQGRWNEALAAFLALIDERDGQAAESHLEAGELYLEQFNDPVPAIYHFRRHLELKQNSPQAEQVRQRIETATRRFARSLPAQPFETTVERVELVERVDQLRAEVAELQRINQQLRRELDGRAIPVVPQVASPRDARTRPTTPPAGSGLTPRDSVEAEAGAAPVETGRIHRVKAGDTLFKIAEQYYGRGQGRRWKEIYEANRDSMPNEQALRIGQELRIP